MKTEFFYIQDQGRLTPADISSLGPNSVVFVSTIAQMTEAAKQSKDILDIYAVGSLEASNYVLKSTRVSVDAQVVYHESIIKRQ